MRHGPRRERRRGRAGGSRHRRPRDRKESPLSVHRIRNKVLAAATALVVGGGLFAGLAPLASRASSHREAPLTAADPQIDNTDVYAFVSPDRPDSVTLVSSWIPFEEPAGGPNFYLWAEHTNYDINISNDGGTNADITYRWKFTTHYRNPNTFLYNTGPVTSLNDPDLNIYQTYDLWKISNGHKNRLLNDAIGGAEQRGRRLHAELQRQPVRRRHHEVRRIEPVLQLGRAVRRPVLPRPPRVRPPVRGEPLRGRRRHAVRVQREHVRAAGPDEGRHQGRRVDDRYLEHGIASQHADRER